MADDEEVKAEETKVNGAAGPIKATLRKEIKANGEDIKELTFREPTGGDIDRCGNNPVKIDFFSGDTPKIEFDVKAMTTMMSLLAAVPPSAIKQLHPKDWNNIAWQLAPFFTPDL